jgi:hypothetical protein
MPRIRVFDGAPTLNVWNGSLHSMRYISELTNSKVLSILPSNNKLSPLRQGLRSCEKTGEENGVNGLTKLLDKTKAYEVLAVVGVVPAPVRRTQVPR